MKKEKTEEERAEKERRRSEKKEKKKNSKRQDKLSQDELQRLEEVRRSLKIKGVNNRSKEQDFSDETDRASVVGLRYSQFFHPGDSRNSMVSPDFSSDSTSTWSGSASASLTRPRGILKSRNAGSVSGSSSKLDLDDEGLLLANTQQNEIICYKHSPGQENDNQNGVSDNIDLEYFSKNPGECVGFKSKRLLSSFTLQLPDVIKIAQTETWKKQTTRSLSSSNLLQVKNLIECLGVKG